MAGFVWYWTGPGIVSFFFFQLRTDWMPESLAFIHTHIHTPSPPHTQAWTQKSSMDMDLSHGHGDGQTPIKYLIWHHQFSVSLQYLVLHRHSDIMVSLVQLVAD
jgi:hypothetical protein